MMMMIVVVVVGVLKCHVSIVVINKLSKTYVHAISYPSVTCKTKQKQNKTKNRISGFFFFKLYFRQHTKTVHTWCALLDDDDDHETSRMPPSSYLGVSPSS